MEQKISDLILLWHNVHVNLGKCIESARVVLDQTDRGTLLPDRVREMRGELIATQDMIPRLADLMEELVGKTVWPMKVEDVAAEGLDGSQEPDPETVAEETPTSEPEPPATAPGDYDAAGSTPTEQAAVDEEAAAEFPDDDAADMDAPELSGTP